MKKMNLPLNDTVIIKPKLIRKFLSFGLMFLLIFTNTISLSTFAASPPADTNLQENPIEDSDKSEQPDELDELHTTDETKQVLTDIISPDSSPSVYVFNISEGDIRIESGTNLNTLKVSQGTSLMQDNIPVTQSITLTGSISGHSGSPITITTSCDIILDSLNIKSTKSPISIISSAYSGHLISLTILGNNRLESTDPAYCGLYTEMANDIMIKGDGSLEILGASNGIELNGLTQLEISGNANVTTEGQQGLGILATSQGYLITLTVSDNAVLHATGNNHFAIADSGLGVFEVILKDHAKVYTDGYPNGFGASLFYPTFSFTVTIKDQAQIWGQGTSDIIFQDDSGNILYLLELTVNDGNNPISDALVQNGTQSTTTDANGKAYLYIPPDQPVSLTVSGSDFITYRENFIKMPSSESRTLSLQNIYSFNTSVFPAGSGTVTAGNAYYSPGDSITLTAAPNVGYVFKEWQSAGYSIPDGIKNNLGIAVIMPSNPVMFTAIFDPLATAEITPSNEAFPTATRGYDVQTAQLFTISNTGPEPITGLSASLGSENFEISTALANTRIDIGQTATVSVRPKTGLSAGTYTDRLTITGSNGISLTADLSFTVNPSSSSSNWIIQQPGQMPNMPTTAIHSSGRKLTKNRHLAMSITKKMVKNGISKAQKRWIGREKYGIALVFDSKLTNVKSLSAIIDADAINYLVSTGIKSISIQCGIIHITLDQQAIKDLAKQSNSKVTLRAIPYKAVKTATNIIGKRPVYKIMITYIKNGKTVAVTNLKNGTAAITLPYTPSQKEVTSCLYGVYVKANKKANLIDESAYDSNAGGVIFTINHFSVYGIGYKAPSARFTDSGSHWAKEFIDYTVSRGLLRGITADTFTPDAAITRGMLATALGRLAGVDTKAYATRSFTDVTANQYDAPYIEWAYQKGIMQSIGNNQFAPDRTITREEIAVILANYTKAARYTLPITREAAAYTDAFNIGSTYHTSVIAMQQAGVMVGGRDNKFNPKTNVTRAEAAAILTRYTKLTINPATTQGWALNDVGQYLYYKGSKALTGWQKIKTNGISKTYYFDTYGNMIFAKWFQINGQWYYFYPDGSLAINAAIDEYKIGPDGTRKKK